MITVASPRMSPMEKALPDAGITPLVLNLTHKNVKDNTFVKKCLEKFGDNKPEIMIIQKDPHFSTSLIKRFKRVSPKTKWVMWYGDQRGQVVVPLIKERIRFLSGLLITNGCPAQKRMYRNAGIKYVDTYYHSFSTDEFREWAIPAKYDLFFGGSRFNAKKFPLCNLRYKLISTLHNKFKLVVHGGGWPFPTENWILRPRYAKELRKAKINIGINHYNVHQYYNRRLFESAASGRLHITYYIPGMEKHFTNHVNIVWFKSIDKCIQNINRYLHDKAARQKLAKNSREFFIKHHSWPVRVKQFKNKIERIL